MMESNKNNKGNIKLNIGMLTIIVLLVSQIIAFAFGYGALRQQVQSNCELIQSYQTNQLTIMSKLDDMNTRITKLEVLLSTLE